MITDAAIKKAKPKDRPFKMGDSGGLYLLVNPGGSKLWRLKYRISGREKLLSIGPYPDISLKNARIARDEAREHIALGRDPGVEKKNAKQKIRQVTQETFRLTAQAYLEKIEKEGRAPATLNKNRWLLNHASQDFGDVPMRDLTAPIILKTLRRFEDRRTYETASRLRTVIGSVCRFAVATSIMNFDPTTSLKGALVRPTRKARAAILDRDEFSKLLKAIDDFDGQPTTRIALLLMALLYPRPGELRQAEWTEFDFDGKVWTIPAHRTKMRRELQVPLAELVLRQLEDLKRFSGNSKLLLPSIRSNIRPMSDNTLNAALRRMGFSSDEVSAHGFRSSFSTMANESGKWNPDAIERALGHQERNEIRRAYARGKYWEERIRMADWWADFVSSLRKY